MSRFSGPQGKGAMRRHREKVRAESMQRAFVLKKVFGETNYSDHKAVELLHAIFANPQPDPILLEKEFNTVMPGDQGRGRADRRRAAGR